MRTQSALQACLRLACELRSRVLFPTEFYVLPYFWLDLLEAAENQPSCVPAVQSAFALLDTGRAQAPEDVGRMSAECVSYRTDPIRACGSPCAVGLTHCSLVAG